MSSCAYSYLVGGLLLVKLTPEEEQEKLNQCGSQGWELVAILPRSVQGNNYLFYYFRRPAEDERTDIPRFDVSSFHA